MVVVLFPRGPNPSKVLQQLLVLQPEQQLSIFNTLRNHLRERGMLPPAVEEAQWRTTPPQQTETVHVLLNSANIHSWLWSQEHTPNRPQELPYNKRVWRLLQTKLSLLTITDLTTRGRHCSLNLSHCLGNQHQRSSNQQQTCKTKDPSTW